MADDGHHDSYRYVHLHSLIVLTKLISNMSFLFTKYADAPHMEDNLLKKANLSLGEFITIV